VRRSLVAAAVAVVALVGATSAWAVFPGQNGRIAYEGSGEVVHTILPSGKGDRAIGPQSSRDTAWSPDGQRLAFTFDLDSSGEPDIYTMGADGGDLRRLTFTSPGETENIGRSSYSPGGGRIMFVSLIHGSVNFWTMRTDGSDARSLGSHVGYVWSPRGEITFDKRGDIWEVRPNGNNEHRLVRDGFSPVYSPDGSEFLFRHISSNGSVHFVLADADGTHVRRPPCGATLDKMGYVDSYSPDGNWILASTRKVGDHGVTGSLFRISLRSCKPVRVVAGVVDDSADWQALPPP